MRNILRVIIILIVLGLAVGIPLYYKPKGLDILSLTGACISKGGTYDVTNDYCIPAEEVEDNPNIPRPNPGVIVVTPPRTSTSTSVSTSTTIISTSTTVVSTSTTVVATSTATSTRPTTTPPITPDGPLRTTYNPRSAEGIIIVNRPAANATVTSPLRVEGEARGSWYFEASFPVILLDQANRVITQTSANAKGEWTTNDFVPFGVEMSFPNQRSGSIGFLVFRRDNPSGLPENDAEVRVPVVFR